MLAEACDLLTENVTVKYDNIAYSIFPYKNRSSGSDPDHEDLKLFLKVKVEVRAILYHIELNLQCMQLILKNLKDWIIKIYQDQNIKIWKILLEHLLNWIMIQ